MEHIGKGKHGGRQEALRNKDRRDRETARNTYDNRHAVSRC